jgi:hypothetical protein
MEYDTSDIIKILVAANELSLHELITYLQSFLIKKKRNWMDQNFGLIYKTSFENGSFLELQKYCTELISKRPDKLFKSSNFSSISEEFLISLIQNDNHQTSEIQVWKYLLKWSISQNFELPPDPKSLSKNDINTLKNSLQKFIPFINFFNLSYKEFLNEVYPYRKVIPKELREKLIEHFLDYDESNHNMTREGSEFEEISSKYIYSKIITFQHSELISKWIDRLDITDEIINSYKFELIFRGSRDGFKPKKFHEICDRTSRTVSIIKVKDSNEILGGYNPIEWESLEEDFMTTEDSFIFSFKNNDNIENHILSRVDDKDHAICRYGPSFGTSDLVLHGTNYGFYGSCSKGSYFNHIRETDDFFNVEEYEVFQIIED